MRAVALLTLCSCAAMQTTHAPAPQSVQTSEGESVAGPVKVEILGASASAQGAELWKRAAAKAPGGQLPREGYVLETGPQGAIILARDPSGALRGRQTLRALPEEGGKRARQLIVDWPEQAWRGLHVLDSGASTLPQLKRLIKEVLGPAKANVLIYEVDYNFRYAKHPELGKGDAWTKATVGELVAAAREEGIQVIPEINCMGHQSWKEPPGELLQAHPDFEEPPDGSSPFATLGSPQFYCRSWCPLHPGVNPLLFDLIDELLEAFGTKTFHAGMDEVFVIASKKCPRCRGKAPAELFAGQVNAIHGHLKSKGGTLMIWADRLLDGDATGYGEWEASKNATAPALDKISKEVVLCDWHYEGGVQGRFPSLDIFTQKGFKVWPTVFKDPAGARAFMNAARGKAGVLGTLASIWYPASKMLEALEGKGSGDQAQIARNAVDVLKRAWNP